MRIGICTKENDKKVLALANSLIKKIKNKGRDIFFVKKGPDGADFILAVGGDGTMLRCAREFSSFKIPLLGINLGRRGFLTETEIAKVPKLIERVLNGGYYIDERMMLEVEVRRSGNKTHNICALNDIVIGKNGIARIIRLEAAINGKLMTNYAGDGLIISTPTGSTGHNLSANGPILDSKLSAMVMTAICSLSISNRSIVVGGDDRIEIRIVEAPKGMEVTLTADGQVVVPLKMGDMIAVKKASYRTQFIRLEDYNFFSVLKNKLGWEGE